MLRFCTSRGWLVATLSLIPWIGLASVGQLSSSLFVRVTQSTDAASTNTAARAVDGANLTYSLTSNQPGSYWLGELGRPYQLTQIALVNRTATNHAEMGGLTLRLLNMDDQVVFQTGLTNPGSGGTNVVSLPTNLWARSVWIGLPGTQTNGAGNYRVGLAEVRAFGVLNLPYGPEPATPATNVVSVWQSSEYPGYPASNAVDGNTGNFTHTGNNANSFWMADLGRVVPLDRIEIVNRSSCCAERLANLVLLVFDGSSNTVSSAVLTNVGLGGTYTHTMTAGTPGRWIRVGLENGQTNGGGNYYVTLAEARAYSGATNVLVVSSSASVPVTNNLASFKTSYMVRLSSSVPGATNANDDSYSTETKTTTQTVDGYWEVDLGATYALYGVRSIAANGISYKLTNTICRLFDAAHESVFAKKLTGTPDVFDTDLNGPVFARYVRVGLEDKQRTDPAGGFEWYIGFREVEVFGRATNAVGVLSFTASTNQVSAGQPVTLSWSVEDVRRVEIHPALGSVGASTASNGVGNLTLTPSNSTEYLLVASNASGYFTRAVGIEVGGVPLSMRISELVADNKFSLTDGYGDASDWVELRNTGNNAVNLAGWGLSDNPANPMKWVFPATNISPHSMLIVFASGRDTPLDAAGNLHASFQLDKGGGALVLTTPDGTNTVDLLAAYPALDTDLAYGRDLEGNWTFMEPTPGAINTGATYLGWLKSLDWSHGRGFFDAGFTLMLTNNSPGATVYFSLDGTLPTIPYTNGLAIAATKSVRAQARRAGYKPGRVQTKTFIFLNDVIAGANMNSAITQDSQYAPRMRPGLLALPTISLVVPTTPTYDEQEGSIEVIWPSGPDSVQENCGVYQYGGSWQTFPKQSFTVAFRASYGANRLRTPLFDGFDHGVIAATSFDKLELNGGNQDMNARGFYMSDRFVQDSMLDMGSLNPHGRFVHLYMNGVYWGQYNCKEPLMESFLADYLGGAAEDYVSVKGNDNVGDNFVLGTPDAPIIQPWERVLSFRNSYNSVRPYLDVSHLIDFMVLWNYGNSETEFRSCGTRNAGSGFKFWMNDPDGFLRTGAGNRTVRNGPGDLFSGLVGENNSDFKTLMADRIYRHYFNNGALTPARLDARLAARMTEINDSLLAECARWGNQTPASWVAGANNVRSNLFPARGTELLGYFRTAGLYPSNDPPTFNQYGGLVTNGFQPQLSSTNGTIYYTLDGSDPRLAGGGIATNALVWMSGAVSISQDTTLNVRVRTATGQWSALAQPRYLLASRRIPTSRDLLITEICYNPAGSDDFEFIELYNAGTNLLDLSGVSLSNAVRFIFPNDFTLAPGAFTMVVEKTSSFAQRFQTPGSLYYWPNLSVAGVWTGALDNAGENIQLLASNGVELASVDYKTSGDWPERADGKGSSIELTTLPATNATDAAVQAFVANGQNWSSSSLYHGSPGRFDSLVKTVRISEVLSHSVAGEDWIELVNTGTTPADLTGCTMTDNLDVPTRWSLTNGTVLQPGEYRVFTATQLGFSLSEYGDDVTLLQVSGTNAVRFLDSVDFPAVEAEEPFGLFTRSDGEHDFTELRATTPASANALPRIGPVVISEIMAAPLAGHAEFIELTSLTNVPVPLFDPAFPTNVWIIEGVGNFAFPTGTVLESRSSLIVCSTNPADFRAQYGVSPSVPVFGPWSGALDASGETLKLVRPGPPKLDGTVPYYRVDHVSYRTSAPWPVVGTNVSLEKICLEAYGNDPVYWRASVTNGTPGTVPSNHPPLLYLTGNTNANELEPLTLTLSSVDLDVPWQSVTLTPLAMPDGSSFDPASGVFTWTPTEAQGPGNYFLTVRVADTGNFPPLSNTVTFTLVVSEVNTPPTLTVPPDQTVAPFHTLVLTNAASDADLPAQPLVFSLVSGPTGAVVNTNTGVFSWTPSLTQSPSTNIIVIGVSDGFATITSNFTVRVFDTENPQIVCPTNLAFSANAGRCSRSNVVFTPTATDNSAVSNVVCVPPSGSTFAVGSRVVTCTATDASGNSAQCAFTVTVTDSENPQLSCPTNLIVTTDAGQCSRSNVAFTVIATDNCAVTNFACVPPSGSTFAPGTTVVTCTALDSSGHSAQCSFTVTVRDADAPQLVCPSPIFFTRDAAQSSKSNVIFTATATDNCAVTNVACVPPSGSTFPLGTNLVICTAADSSGNTAACGFNVIVTTLLIANVSDAANQRIPDGSPVGLASSVNVATSIERITDLQVMLNISGGFNGDLHAYLVHDSGHAILLNRPGKTFANPSGYSDAGFNVTLNDHAANGDIHNYRVALSGNPNTPLPGPLTGAWAPDGRDADPALVLDASPRSALLSAFAGLNPNGRWTLFIADVDALYTSTLVSWGLQIFGSNAPPVITAPPQSRTNIVTTTATLNVTATGLSALSYQWYFNVAPLPGATNALLSLANVQTTHTGGYKVAVTSLGGSVTSQVATLTVIDQTVNGLVEMEFYTGLGGNGAGNRWATFKGTDATNGPLATWSLPLDFTNRTASFTLPHAPLGLSHLSAKTAWHLRTRRPVNFLSGAAAVNFTSASALRAGDLDESNLVDFGDYLILAGAWYTADPAADLDGSGLVDILDYFLLSHHWQETGDSE